MLSIHQVSQKLSVTKDEALEIMQDHKIKTKFIKGKIGRGTWYCEVEMEKIVEIRDEARGRRNGVKIEQQNEAAKLLISLLDKRDYGMVTAASERAA